GARPHDVHPAHRPEDRPRPLRAGMAPDPVLGGGYGCGLGPSCGPRRPRRGGLRGQPPRSLMEPTGDDRRRRPVPSPRGRPAPAGAIDASGPRDPPAASDVQAPGPDPAAMAPLFPLGAAIARQLEEAPARCPDRIERPDGVALLEIDPHPPRARMRRLG